MNESSNLYIIDEALNYMICNNELKMNESISNSLKKITFCLIIISL